MTLVVDASVAIGWVLRDEDPAYAQAVLEQVLVDGALVPAIWPFEIANVLLSAVKRKRLTADEIPKAMSLIESLPIEIEPATNAPMVRRLFEVGRDFSLTAYDAAYLDLSFRSGLALATADSGLVRSASAAGATLFVPGMKR